MQNKDKDGKNVSNIVFYYNVPEHDVHPQSPEARIKIRAYIGIYTMELRQFSNGDQVHDQSMDTEWLAEGYSSHRCCIHNVSAEWEVRSLDKAPPPYIMQHVWPDYGERDVIPFAACRAPPIMCDSVEIFARIDFNPINVCPDPDHLNAWIWDADNAFQPQCAADLIPYDRSPRLWDSETMEPIRNHGYSFEKSKLCDMYIRKLYDQSQYFNDLLLERLLVNSQVILSDYGWGNAAVMVWENKPTKPAAHVADADDHKDEYKHAEGSVDAPMQYLNDSQSVSMPPTAIKTNLSPSESAVATKIHCNIYGSRAGHLYVTIQCIYIYQYEHHKCIHHYILKKWTIYTSNKIFPSKTC